MWAAERDKALNINEQLKSLGARERKLLRKQDGARSKARKGLILCKRRDRQEKGRRMVIINGWASNILAWKLRDRQTSDGGREEESKREKSVWLGWLQVRCSSSEKSVLGGQACRQLQEIFTSDMLFYARTMIYDMTDPST